MERGLEWDIQKGGLLERGHKREGDVIQKISVIQTDVLNLVEKQKAQHTHFNNLKYNINGFKLLQTTRSRYFVL